MSLPTLGDAKRSPIRFSARTLELRQAIDTKPHAPGNSYLHASNYCSAPMIFGDEADVEPPHQMLEQFVDAEGNLIDTADVDSQGTGEILAAWLQSYGRQD